MTCIFCDILAGKAPADFVYQDESSAAFMDIRPINPGHVLVVPRIHAALLTELNRISVGHLMEVAQRIDTALRKSGIKCEAVNLFLADGGAAGQEVFHVHLHVIPRFASDGHHLRFSPSYYLPNPEGGLKKVATLIRVQIGDEK
jgi:histidine triad (HIT) family protein